MEPLSITTAVLTSFIPAISDGLKTIVNKFFGSGPKPQNVDEAIKLMNAETERLGKLAELDKPEGNIYPWVSSIRALQRPVAVALVLTGFLIYPDKEFFGQLASMAIFYLFGDRTYSYFRKSDKR